MLSFVGEFVSLSRYYTHIEPNRTVSGGRQKQNKEKKNENEKRKTFSLRNWSSVCMSQSFTSQTFVT